MVDKIASQLFLYGPLGVICVILLGGCVYLYLQKDKREREYQAEIRQLQDRHRDELKIMMERHIAKSETWNDKYSQMVGQMQAVVESLEKRFLEASTYSRRGGGVR